MKTIARFGKTRLVVQGWTWLPVAQLITWLLAAWWAGRHRPERTLAQRLGLGALLMPLVLSMEWGHNLAHTAAAYLVRRPLDAMRIILGMPLLIYKDVNDPTVSPGQHIIRAVGGPLFNAVMLVGALLWRRSTRPGSVAREMADVAVATNQVLTFAGFTPVPMLDGGPILKWSLVSLGQSRAEAERSIKRLNWLVGPLLSVVGWLAFRRGRRWQGALLVQLGGLCLLVARGLLDENSDLGIAGDL